MDSEQVIGRVEAERQALALMDHPNIARAFDGTTSTGRLYFVMELVDGLPLMEYRHQHDLSLPDRLAIFIPICHAIQHAHQKGSSTAISSPRTCWSVAPAPVSTSMNCGGPQATFGNPVTCKATVAGVVPAAGVLTWTIDGSTGTANLDAAGAASVTTTRADAGAHTVVASFASQGNFAAAAPKSESFTVRVANTSTVLTASDANPAFSSPVTLTATVSSAAGAPSAGTVTSFDVKTPIGTGSVNSAG